jgi:hypothetical protein
MALSGLELATFRLVIELIIIIIIIIIIIMLSRIRPDGQCVGSGSTVSVYPHCAIHLFLFIHTEQNKARPACRPQSDSRRVWPLRRRQPSGGPSFGSLYCLFALV